MSKIWFVPIEPLEERYSIQWLKWFPGEFERLGVDFKVIDSEPLSETIRQGSFLDVIGTNYYKAGQLKTICEVFEDGEVKDGDSFLLADGWFPGLEMLAYIRDALELKFKIYSIWHAGTYDPYDFLTQKYMEVWAHLSETAWLTICDGVFVATQFHKDMIIGKRKVCADKIHITGLPIYPEFVKNVPKKNIVVFPHRLDVEKQPKAFDTVAEELRPKYPGWNFVKTKDLCKTKQEYYNLLNMAKISVSCALQETWGIAMIESVMCECLPIVPDRLSYKELYSYPWRYESFEELLQQIRNKIDNYEDWWRSSHFSDLKTSLIRLGETAIEKMVKIMEV